MNRSRDVTVFFLALMVVLIAPPVPISHSCDTMVALPDATVTGTTILGKNSDRPIYDSQPLILNARQAHAAGSTLKLEYIEIPQVAETYATIGSSPYWCWGYEEGMNEFGVTIGNEAIFTKTFKEKAEAFKAGKKQDLGLLGMDLLRLGLERGKTAREALQVITDLVSEYGQWGSGCPNMPHDVGGYDNSYIIADASEAWILETVGTRWIAKRVGRGVAAISNQPGIRHKWDLASEDIVDYAIQKGWWPEGKRTEFDFALAYLDVTKPLQLSQCRVARSHQLLRERKNGDVCPRWMMRILRDHYETTFLGGPFFNAALPDFLTICMHVSPAGFTWGNTASSVVAIVPKGEDKLHQFWWTPVTPCTGVYVPFFPNGTKLPDIVSTTGKRGKTVTAPPEAKPDEYSPDSYWWLFRELIDIVKGDELGGAYNVRQPFVRAAFDRLEKKFAAETAGIEKQWAGLKKAGKDAEAAKLLDDFTAKCVNEVLITMKNLKEAIQKIQP